MAQDHDHRFDCRQCGAHFDSQDELNRHNRENHSQSASQSGQIDQSGTDNQSDRSSSRL